jgi:hypothetical protein
LVTISWLTDGVFASVGMKIDIIPVVTVSNACSTLVEYFADVSTYGIFNESANF